MKNKILLFSIGFVVFSSFLNFLTVRLLGLPCVIEFFVLPLLYIYRRNLNIPTIEVFYVFVFVLLGTLIGSINPVYMISDIIPIARCFLIGSIAFVIGKNNNVFKNIDNLYSFCFGVFCGDFVNALILMTTILGTKFDREYAVDINIIFSVLWVVLTILYKKPKYLIAMLVLVPSLAFMSVSRGVSTFFFVAIILAFFLKIIKSPSKIVFIGSFLTVSFFILSDIYINNEEAVRKFSPSMHFRLYKKVRSYGKNKTDGGRIAPYYWAAENITYYTVPRGFLGKNFLKNPDKDDTPLVSPWDCSYMELLYTFGFVPFILIIGIVLYKLIKCFMFYITTSELLFAALSVLLATMLIEHFFGYGLIRSPFTIASSWGILGFLWRITRYPDSLIGTLINSSDDKN